MYFSTWNKQKVGEDSNTIYIKENIGFDEIFSVCREVCLKNLALFGIWGGGK